jgi:Domain of unknown function (DUF4251)
MKKIVFFTLTLLFISSLFAQTNENKKLTKQEKKELKESGRKKAKEGIISILNEKRWVVEMTRVYSKDGSSFTLDSDINFISVDGNKIVIQLGFDQLNGWNGVGGITLTGTISKYEINEGKKDKSPAQVKIRATGGTMGTVNIDLSIPTGTDATAYITGNFGENPRLNGYFKSLDKTRIFKGFESN